MFKVEMHCHTYPASCDSHITPEALVRNAKEKGYNGIVVTNHFDMLQLAKFRKPLRQMCDWNCSKCITERTCTNIPDIDSARCYDKWLSGISETRICGEKMGIKVFAGCEYSLSGHTSHISILGLTIEEMRHEQLQWLQPIEYLVDLKQRHPEILLICNHPDRNICNPNPYEVDGFERFNTKNHENARCDHLDILKDMMSPEVLREKILICGSDAHTDKEFGSSSILFEKELTDEKELCKELKAHRYKMCIEI